MYGSSRMAQRAKDLASPQMWHRSQVQCGFNPWHGNFHVPWTQWKRERKWEGRREGKNKGRKERRKKGKERNVCTVHRYSSHEPQPPGSARCPDIMVSSLSCSSMSLCSCSNCCLFSCSCFFCCTSFSFGKHKLISLNELWISRTSAPYIYLSPSQLPSEVCSNTVQKRDLQLNLPPKLSTNKQKSYESSDSLNTCQDTYNQLFFPNTSSTISNLVFTKWGRNLKILFSCYVYVLHIKRVSMFQTKQKAKPGITRTSSKGEETQRPATGDLPSTEICNNYAMTQTHSKSNPVVPVPAF